MASLNFLFNVKSRSVIPEARKRYPGLRILLFFIIFFLISCTKKESPSQNNELVKKGKVIYNSHCIVCHNMDPKKSGVLGPELVESHFELLKLKVTQNKYPENYSPKRKTQLMALTNPMKTMTDEELLALEAYLNSFKD